MRSSINRAVLFDFDGTLLDSFRAHYRAYEKMFAQYGIVIDPQTFVQRYVPDWQSTYRAFGLAEEHWPDANALWRRVNSLEEAPLRDACMPVLAALQPQWRLGMVSSGSHGRVWEDLRRTGLDAHMEVVVTGNDVTERKPSPEGILQALEKLAVPASQAVYVGDTPIDQQTALAAQVRFIGIRSDYATFAADPMIETLSELPARLSL
jgi:phosphoglycolate phosphatase